MVERNESFLTRLGRIVRQNEEAERQLANSDPQYQLSHPNFQSQLRQTLEKSKLRKGEPEEEVCEEKLVENPDEMEQDNQAEYWENLYFRNTRRRK